MDFSKKENKIRVVITAIVIILVAVATKYSLAFFKSELQKSNTTLLNGIAEENSLFITEKINADVDALKVAADMLGQKQYIFSVENIQDIIKLAQTEGYASVFLTDMEGNTLSSDGVHTEHKDLVQTLQQREVFISDITKSESYGDILSISVRIMENDTMVGVFTGVYRAQDYANRILKDFSDGNEIYYILKNTGQAIALPSNGNDNALLSFDYQAGFEQNALENELSILPSELQEQKSGIIKWNTDENNVNYVAYYPLHVNDWYLLLVMPEEQYSLKNVTDMTTKIVIAVDVIILILAIAMIWGYQSRKASVANTDSITQLNSRQAMINFYESKYKNKKGYFFAMLSIDNFDTLNHIFDYEVASKVLKDMAEMIKPFVEQDELASRLNEDRFGLILKAANKAEATKRLKEILAQLKKIKINYKSSAYDYNLSYTVSAELLQDKQDFNVILKHTMKALEKARKNKQQIMFWDSKLKEQMTAHDALVADMNRALQNKEFVPYFHMQYDTEQQQFVGAEVLAVWQHPEKGIIPQEDFVSVLKATNLLLELDMILLEEVCKKQKIWLDKGLVPLPLTVNISRLNMHRVDFVKEVKETTERYHISPSLIVLEIAEAAIYDNIQRTKGVLASLKELGFQISVANFSSGYSFLNIMRKMPVDNIKLEKEFFPKDNQSEKDTVVIKNIVDIAKTLQIQVIAEGIETENQAEFLKEMNCCVVQGYQNRK